MKIINLGLIGTALFLVGCVSTPKPPELTANNPASTEAKEGSVDVSAITLIEQRSNQIEENKDSSEDKMGGVHHHMKGMDMGSMQMNMGTK